jgi:nicotinamide mononucleotide transporter
MHIIHFLQEWWSHQTWPEIIAVITGLLCVYLAAVNNIWNWPFAIISVGIYIFIFFEARLYADMGLQFYFLAMNIYGWYYWSHKPATEQKTPVILIKKQETIVAAIAVVLFTFILGSVLKYTTASFPYLDSFCTACSLVAQYLLARKVLQNWLIWIFVDIIYVGLYSFKELHLTAIMYAIYISMALLGYLDWRKEYRKQMTKT